MPDHFDHFAQSLEAPAAHGFPISPDNANDLPQTTRALYVGTGGAIALFTASGAELVFANVPSGSILPVRARRIKASGTTASQVVGLV